MNCSECEQFFDAYLDGQLAGSLRLEFDAHRLRCRHCQQTLAMLETVGHVLASDPPAPSLSEEFTARVMCDIAAGQPRKVRFPLTRVAVVAGALLQAAAVLALAVFWNAQSGATKTTPTPVPAVTVETDDDEGPPGYEAVHRLIAEGIEDRLWDAHAAGAKLGADITQLARYLNIAVPEDVARETSKLARVNPWQAVWDVLTPAEEDEPEPAPPAEDVHSI